MGTSVAVGNSNNKDISEEDDRKLNASSKPVMVDDPNKMEVHMRELPSSENSEKDAPVVASGDDTDDEAGGFDLRVKRKRKKNKRKALQISIALPPPLEKVDKGEQKSECVDDMPKIRALDFLREEEEICYDFDFEDFDVENANGPQPRTADEAALLVEKEADVAKIQAYLKAKWEERTKDVQNQVNRLRADMLSKQERQRSQLADNHKRQLAEDEQRMDEGLNWLKREQKKELDMKIMMHQRDAQNGGNLDPDFLAQLQARHHEQLKQFEEKKRDLRMKSEKELRSQSIILSTHHKKRQTEADWHVQNSLAKKCFERHELLKAKLLKLHTERYDRKLLELRSKRGKVDISKLYVASSPSQPDRGHSESSQSQFDVSICHHAVTRHKRRKMSTNNASFGMSIEVHNEGINIMTKCASEHLDVPLSRKSNVFLPWGVKARKILHSVMCGEIPSSEINLTNLSCSGKRDIDGGMVRCMITDMRTSKDTAACHRADAYMNNLASTNRKEIEHLARKQSDVKKQIKALESEYKNAAKAEEEAVNSEADAAKAHKGSRDTWQLFKNQAQHFFSNVSQDNKSKLLEAMRKYKEDYEATKNQLVSSKKLVESASVVSLSKKMELERLTKQAADIDQTLEALKRGRTTSEHSAQVSEEATISTRVNSVISSIYAVAEKRRSIVNEKKSNGNMCAEWSEAVNGLDDIDVSIKKSIWQKMQRKRVNTVLRPSHRFIKTKSSFKEFDCFDMGNGDSTVHPSVRAEELLLLALHPETPALSTASEVEPGWHVCLDVPQYRNPHSILYIDRTGLVSQSFLSVCCSTGRQTASFLEPHHLRTLDDDTSLSFATRASALAETKILCHKKATQDIIDNDPLAESDEQRQLGLSFIVREPDTKHETPTKKPPVKKRKSKAKEDRDQKTTTSAKSKAGSKKSERRQESKSRKKPKTDPEQRQLPTINPLAIPTTLNAMGQLPQAQLAMRDVERNRIFEAQKQMAMNQSANPTGPGSQQHSFINPQQQQQQQPKPQQLQQQFQNFFTQHPLVHGPGAFSSASPQLQQMSFNYLQAQQQQQQRLALTQPQMAQLMQQNNMMGNNTQMQNAQHLISLSQPQMAEIMQRNMMGNNNIQMQNLSQNQGLGPPQFQQNRRPSDKK